MITAQVSHYDSIMEYIMHADITNGGSNNVDNTDHLIYFITGSVVGSVTLLVVCVLFVPVMICLILRCHAKKDDVSNHDRPDVPIYECITGPVYEYLNLTAIISVMTENEAYNASRNSS